MRRKVFEESSRIETEKLCETTVENRNVKQTISGIF